ncbi:hypothetical protein SAY86_022034 [Trapa natans]|uniref:Uncharacterized protein n=1 Tax=Trapa natans TaxID=22666 RepID=A0AAN7MLF4_TRANT|nr:hypothetical protein SAY86_022034 [Trapa natans]
MENKRWALVGCGVAMWAFVYASKCHVKCCSRHDFLVCYSVYTACMPVASVVLGLKMHACEERRIIRRLFVWSLVLSDMVWFLGKGKHLLPPPSPCSLALPNICSSIIIAYNRKKIYVVGVDSACGMTDRRPWPWMHR